MRKPILIIFTPKISEDECFLVNKAFSPGTPITEDYHIIIMFNSADDWVFKLLSERDYSEVDLANIKESITEILAKK